MDAAEANVDGRSIVTEGEVLEHLRISSLDLCIEEFIDYGSVSRVYRANWLGCEVAVKEILVSGSFESYKKEVEILMRLPHPHVVQVLGFCVDGKLFQGFAIVMERLEAPLSRVIHDRLRASSRRRPFDVCEGVDILTKVALGMKFLHSREIVHGGLSTDIILMNVHCEKGSDVKIAGFASSDYANCDSPTVSFPPHYIYHMFPPEILAGDHSRIKVTKAVDVYSFGTICYAVLTGYEIGLPPWNEDFTRDDIIRAAVSGLRPELIPPDVDHDLMNLIFKCWDAEPEHRPPFSVTCETLAGIRAARGRQSLTTLKREESDALGWTTHRDDNDTFVEIATIMETLPSHLSIDPVDVEWRRPIGRGGYTMVYEVNWLGCTFAAKRFKLFYASLKEEVEFLIKLQHPHIARLIGLSIDSNGGWIMMERMETDLQKLICSRAASSSPPFSGSEARELCFKIALGMRFLHSKNVVHRDIKSANVLVHDHHGRFDVKIADFGVSHRIGNPSVANYAGTGLWRAPEVLRAKRDEPLTEDQLKKTDVYSFGITCYEIVTGHDLHQHLSARDVIAKR